jgi:acetolactate synthase regulatory subunit
MPAVVHFLGKVLPQGFQINVRSPRPYKYLVSNMGKKFDIECSVEIIDGIVATRCTLERFETTDIPHILPHVIHLTQGLVNLVAFHGGYGMIVYFDGIVLPNGETTAFISKNFDLARSCTAYTLDPEHLDEFFAIIMTDGMIALALNDLVHANYVSTAIPVNCARAIEVLRNQFVREEEPRSESWRRMRTHLQISQPYLQLITDHSIGARHGERPNVGGEITNEIMARSWEIMNRFLIYRRLGDTPLIGPLFPLL